MSNSQLYIRDDVGGLIHVGVPTDVRMSFHKPIDPISWPALVHEDCRITGQLRPMGQTTRHYVSKGTREMRARRWRKRFRL